MFRRRLYVTLGLLLLAGIVLLARLAQVQLLWHDRFRRDRYTRPGGDHVVDTVRGGIYTRWGTPLAVQEPCFDIGVYYDRLEEPGWRARVARLCSTPVEQIQERVDSIMRRVERIHRAVQENTGLEHVRVVEQNQPHWVVRGVSPEVAAAVRSAPAHARRRPEVVVMESTRRLHPNGDLAPHVVGEVGAVSPEKWRELCAEDRYWTMSMPVSRIGSRYKKDDRLGLSGVEAAHEGLLRGSRGYVVNRLAFRILGIERKSEKVPPTPGRDIYLTLREDFQEAATGALERAASSEELDFDRGALVLLDPRNGAVLAAATYPSFDRSTYRAEFDRLANDSRAPLLFRPLQAALQTGSVYKIVTAMAALHEGAITPNTTFTCHGRKAFRGRNFHCWIYPGGHGTLSLVPAIENSCNIYFYQTGLATGGEALARWGRKFGLGQSTGVDWPYERAGQVPDARSTFQTVNLSIGQGGLLCNPLQVANMAAAVANGGRLYTPHFFHHATDSSGETVEVYRPDFVDLQLDRSALEAVRRGMRLVVDSGTARRAGLERFRAAGKTGTAELGPEGIYHAWFAGYAPAESPKVAFAVLNERTSGHGSSHAAPIVQMALESIWDEVERMP